MYEALVEQGYSQVKLVGIGKSVHSSYLSNWTSNNDVSVCADPSSDFYPTWTSWNASQRDLFILDSEGQVVFHESISGGFDATEISNLIISLIPEIPTCDEVENPAGCFQLGCDEGFECIDYANDGGGDCIPSSCWCDELTGGWFCTEDCNGGACYPIQSSIGDINNDSQINVIDVVLLVNFILGNNIPTESEYASSDINGDGNLNVLDVVSLVGNILGN